MHAYSPTTLVLTLSFRCNLDCGHCIVEAEPRAAQTLRTATIDSALHQAKPNGIRSVSIYGGEPFLYINDLLPYTIRKTFEEKFPFVSTATNGFWGRTEQQAHDTLSKLEDAALEGDGTISLGLSVDQYHQPNIPAQSIANIISEYRRGAFEHIRLGIHTFREQPSFDTVGDVFKACDDDHKILLVESNGPGYIYPAFEPEFIKVVPKNFPFISGKLRLPQDADEKMILTALSHTLGVEKSYYELVQPSVMARHTDIGDGKADYVIFPEKKYILDFIVDERVIHAGRARKGGELETSSFDSDESDTDYLVISPNGQAYAYPAHMSSEAGVPIGDKPLAQVIREVKGRW